MCSKYFAFILQALTANLKIDNILKVVVLFFFECVLPPEGGKSEAESEHMKCIPRGALAPFASLFLGILLFLPLLACITDFLIGMIRKFVCSKGDGSVFDHWCSNTHELDLLSALGGGAAM